MTEQSAHAPRNAPDCGNTDYEAGLVRQFVKQRAEYYVRQFERLGEAVSFRPSFNLAATILGPIWLGARNLWTWVLVFSVLELFAVTVLAMGLWGDLGAAERDRAQRIMQILEVRRGQAQDALVRDPERAVALQRNVESLERAVENAIEASELAAGRGYLLALYGSVILATLRLLQGIIGNWALERRFERWRSDRTQPTGINTLGAVATTAFTGVLYSASIAHFTTTQPLYWLSEFPADPGFSAQVSTMIAGFVAQIATGGAQIFGAITYGIIRFLDAVEFVLVGSPWVVVALLIVILALKRAGWWMAAFAAVVLGYMGVMGFWDKAMSTVALLGVAAFISISFGIPAGILCARRPKVYAMVRPVLDLMQTMPAFVYLIPVIAFFGTGKPAAIIATLIFGSPPVVRLTVLGLRGVPESVREAATAFGASPWYLLLKVDLPLAAPSIKAGVNQTIMLSLSMVVVASLIGAKGLGEDVLAALQFASVGHGILAGMAILFIAIILDRIVQGRKA